MTERQIFSPESSDEIKPLFPDPSRPDGSDSRTESAGEPEQPHAWRETEENDADDEEEDENDEDEDDEDADDEEEEDDEEEDDEDDRLVQAFTPNVMILQSTRREHTQIPMEEIPMEEIPMEKIPVKKIPMEKIPVEEIPVKKIPKEEIPVEKIPVKKIPKEEIPVEKIPVEEIPVKKIPMEKIPVEEIPVKKIPKEEIPVEKIPVEEQSFSSNAPQHFQPAWIRRADKPEDSSCVEVVRVCVCVTAAALIFPLLTWAGYKLLPFDAPPLDSAPLRLLYTLRCAFFASVPIVLGVLVQGVSRLRFGTMKPLFDGTWENRKVAVHGRFVRDSLHLHLLFFLQLAVMATYAQQDLLKLVPLLTIVFVLGRLIYWVCVAFGSCVRALGLALSFLPLLPLLAANLYFIGSVGGPEAVFDVAPPTTAPPPKLRWWG
ncbi:hypothetical protein R3I93_016668 [Phoxinus phoxinus]|uniref:Transmembrane protein 79 n=1 Tax=Phoxinus phoxinus TaxID=58324 RepID=A0AAN9CN00_9TELE